MRKLRGRTLGDALTATPALADRLALVPAIIRVADAVGHAHARGVVHRDLEPSNVVLGELGEVTVIDWGIAKIADAGSFAADGALDAAPSSATATQSGALLGTPSYMAPEQAAGRNDEVDARTDVFALGAIPYELLCGRPPHTGSTAMAAVASALDGSIEPLDRAAPDAPPALRAICERALSRDHTRTAPPRVTALVFVALTLGAGVMGTSMGVLSVLRAAAEPNVLADDRAWRELVTIGAYESFGNFVLGLARARCC